MKTHIVKTMVFYDSFKFLNLNNNRNVVNVNCKTNMISVHVSYFNLWGVLFLQYKLISLFFFKLRGMVQWSPSNIQEST